MFDALFSVIWPPSNTTVQFPVEPAGPLTVFPCCSFNDEGLSVVKGPVQNVSIIRHRNPTITPV